MLIGMNHDGLQNLLILLNPHRVVRPNDDHNIVCAGKLTFKQPNTFSKQAFHAISTDRGAESAGNAEAPAIVGQGIGLGIDHQGPAGLPVAGRIDRGENASSAEAMRAGKFMNFFGHRHICSIRPRLP